MIVIACPACHLAIRVMGSPEEVQTLVGEESSFWPDAFPCPKCERKCRAVHEIDVDASVLHLVDVIDLTPQEAFIAFNGVGLPSERMCVQEEVLRLFQTPVRRVSCSDLFGTQRCIIEYLEFWDGTKMYFGSSPAGAIIYRIVSPPDYAGKIKDVETTHARR